MTESVWSTLSKIDCNAHIEKKGRFSYLSWTWAWAMVKTNYPNAVYSLDDDIRYPDGTMEVRCSVTIEGLTHQMWLPVLDNKNAAIANPNAFDVNSSRMRCLVKCLAMFGLGHYIYAGESVPQDAMQETKPAYVVDDNAKKWVEYAKKGGDLNKITDPAYRNFIQSLVGA